MVYQYQLVQISVIRASDFAVTIRLNVGFD